MTVPTEKFNSEQLLIEAMHGVQVCVARLDVTVEKLSEQVALQADNSNRITRLETRLEVTEKDQLQRIEAAEKERTALLAKIAIYVTLAIGLLAIIAPHITIK